MLGLAKQIPSQCLSFYKPVPPALCTYRRLTRNATKAKMAANEASFEDKIAPAPGSPDYGHSSPADSASLDDEYQLYKRSDVEEIDLSEAHRVRRKIDLRIIPILTLIYMMQYLDKNGINYASVYGLQKGTNLHGQDYSWLGSIFYFGRLLVQYTLLRQY